VRITLHRADGRLAGDRTVDGPYACAELADAAAILIAVWKGVTPPDPAAPGPAPGLAAAPAPVAGPPPSTVPRWELGAGLGGSVAAASARPALQLSAAVTPWGRWGLRSTATADGPREDSLGAGRVRWWRPALFLGPQGALDLGGSSLQGHVGLGAGLLTTSGRGFVENHGHVAVRPGALAAVRLAWRRGRSLSPWVELNTTVWPGRVEVYQEPEALARRVPWFTLQLALGLSLLR
jgi:hypothetical protein